MNTTLKIICLFAGVILGGFGTTSVNAAEKVEHQGKSVDYEQLKIKSYKHWDVYLHENQCYLGRVFVQLKKADGIDDFLDIKGEVRDEFFRIGEEIKSALNTLFKPDKMNYAALSNVSPVIHVHIIPRYQEARTFAGKVFKDTRWGQNYAPYDRSFVVDEAVLFQIRDALKQQLL
jgi:diadenosine tetraphosphate (Ap4A) HIT family hydrolase